MEKLLLFLKGMAMGAADVVPGVSGGTIAFITGIYDDLISSIRSVLSRESIKNIFRFDFKAFWDYINGTFLAILLSGIFVSVVSLAKVMGYLLREHPVWVWSFFFGLIISSAVLVFKKIKSHNAGVFLSMIAGIIIAYAITSLSPAETPEALWFIFLSGAIAICAMILPGISGSFLLVLMGKYEFILNSLTQLNLKVVITFILGCATGILSFSHLLNWLLKKYHDLTVAMLAGFMIGSLNKVWPWKKTLSTYIDRHGVEKALEQANISPYGQNSSVIIAFCLMFAGFALVLAIENFAGKNLKFIDKAES